MPNASMVRVLRALLFSAIALASGLCSASESGVLVAGLPNDAEPQTIVALVRKAFVARRWTIESSDETSVTATLHRQDTNARLRIWIDGGVLRYEDSSTRTMPTTRAPNAAFTRMKQPLVLSDWLENLQGDIRAGLAGIAHSTPESRLAALERLRASGTITEDEYRQKRAEILKAL